MLRELECVLQQVSDGREKHVAVDVNREALVDIGDRKLAFSGTRLERRGDPDLIDEIGKGNQFVPRRHSGRDAHIGKRSIDERAQSDQATLQHRPGRAVHSDFARFDGGDGECRRMNEVPQIVREKSQPLIQCLNAVVRHDGIALVGVFRHGIGDAIVEAAVESSKFVYFDRHLALECQIRDGLAEIAIVVNDLIHRKSLLQSSRPCSAADAPISDNTGLPPPAGPETLRLRMGSEVCST